ncbi:hypothetical protein D3Z50_00455 [Clostridiaceae bacterium]|jgi:hypothetical protein|nr:hypothetical protein [Clostridium sp.]NBI69558.1 hypothetical protein [Clostridiaceae bacterium]
MSDYSYSKEFHQDNVTFCEFDLAAIQKMFTRIFESYNPRVKDEAFDSFCEDFYDLAKGIQISNERMWRMIITDMLFNYDDRGYLESGAADNGIKRKQFAIIAKVILGILRAKN